MPTRGCSSCGSRWNSTCHKMMVHFYLTSSESILTSSIYIWMAVSTAKDKGRLQQIIRSAKKVISCNLPSLLDLCNSRTRKQEWLSLTLPISTISSSIIFLPAKGTGLLRPKPRTTWTVSFQWQWVSQTSSLPLTDWVYPPPPPLHSITSQCTNVSQPTTPTSRQTHSSMYKHLNIHCTFYVYLFLFCFV